MVTRVGGLASGMDIDALVEKLMTAEKAPLNKLYQNKQKYEWQRDAYRDVNTQLKSFDDFLFNEMTLSKDLSKKTVVSTSSAISAVSTTGSNNQSLTIDSVDQLARSGSVSGTLEKDLDLTATTMMNLNPSFTGTQTVELAVLQADGKFKAHAIDIHETDTVDAVLSKFKNIGLNSFYDKQSGKIGFSTKETGTGSADEAIKALQSLDPDTEIHADLLNADSSFTTSVFINSGQDIFSTLGVNNDSTNTNAAANFISNGQNAKFTINGVAVERSKNTFELEGFNVTLNNTHHSSGQPITLTTKVDADNMVDKIKKFVETYNGLVASFTATTKEPKYRDFAPLTDEQKAEMEEKDIENWEKKAKSGVLRGDSILRSVLGDMRETMYSSGGGKQDNRATKENFINTLYEMGITTSNKTSDNGKLILDEEKLRAAIEKDPDQVFKTFSDTSKETPGLVQQLRSNIDSAVKNIEKKAGKTDSTNASFQIGRYINDAENRINTWKDKLANIEQRYWSQFNAMEQAINKSNTQSSALFSGQTM